jgi:hypothetical protein
MVINKWRLEAVVRQEPGLSLAKFATELGVCKPTALRHARRHKFIVVEDGRRGKGKETRLWLRWDLPSHLQSKPTQVDAALVIPELRIFNLDEI